jgi:hypothetical protein
LHPFFCNEKLTFLIKDLRTFLNERPSAYLDEMAWFIWDEYEVIATESTISRELKKMNWSRKAVKHLFLF